MIQEGPRARKARGLFVSAAEAGVCFLHCIGADTDFLYRHLEVFVRDSHCLGRVARFVVLTCGSAPKVGPYV